MTHPRLKILLLTTLTAEVGIDETNVATLSQQYVTELTKKSANFTADGRGKSAG
jgi:hypothetical protein